MTVLVATEFQLRVREGDASLEGSVDLQVVLQIALHGAVGLFALTRLRLPRHGPPSLLAAALALYTGALTFTVMYSPVPRFAVVRMAQWYCVLLLVMAIAQAASRSSVHLALHGYLVLCLVSTAAGLVAGYSWPTQPGRLTWINVHPNGAAKFLSLAAVITVAYLSSQPLRAQCRWRSGVYWWVLVVTLAALVGTGSRTSMAATVVGMGVVVALVARRRVDAAVLAGLGVSLVGLLGSSAALAVARKGQTPEEMGTLTDRTHIWDRAFELIAEHPVLGYGYGASREVFTYAFRGADGSELRGVGGAHNAVLEVVIDGGWMAGVLMIGLLCVVVANSWTAANGRGGVAAPDGAIGFGVVSVLVITGFTTQGLAQPATMQTVWLLFVVAWLLLGRRERVHGRSGRDVR